MSDSDCEGERVAATESESSESGGGQVVAFPPDNGGEAIESSSFYSECESADRKRIRLCNANIYRALPFPCPTQPFRDFVCKPEYNRPPGTGVVVEDSECQKPTDDTSGDMCKPKPLVFIENPMERRAKACEFPGPCDVFGIPKPCEEACTDCIQDPRKFNNDSDCVGVCDDCAPLDNCGYDPSEDCDQSYDPASFPTTLSNGQTFFPEPFSNPEEPFNDFSCPIIPDLDCNEGDEEPCVTSYSDPCGDHDVPYYDEINVCECGQPPAAYNENRDGYSCGPNQDGTPSNPNDDECCTPVTGFNYQNEIQCGPEFDRELAQPPPSDQEMWDSSTTDCPNLCLQLLRESQNLLEIYRGELQKASTDAYRAAILLEHRKCSAEVAKYKNALICMRNQLILSQLDRSCLQPLEYDSIDPFSNQAGPNIEPCYEPPPLFTGPSPETQYDDCDDDYDPPPPPSCRGVKKQPANCPSQNPNYSRPQTSPPTYSCNPSSPAQVNEEGSCLDDIFAKVDALEEEIRVCRREKQSLQAKLMCIQVNSKNNQVDDCIDPAKPQACQSDCKSDKKPCAKSMDMIKPFRASCQGCENKCQKTSYCDTTSALRNQCHISLDKLQSVFGKWDTVPPTLSTNKPHLTLDEACKQRFQTTSPTLLSLPDKMKLLQQGVSKCQSAHIANTKDSTKGLFCSCPGCIRRRYGATAQQIADEDDDDEPCNPYCFDCCPECGRNLQNGQCSYTSTNSNNNQDVDHQDDDCDEVKSCLERDRCNCPDFEMDDKGQPIYEGGMCINRLQNYIWKHAESSCNDCSFRSLGIDPNAADSMGAESTTAPGLNPVKYVGGADFEQTKNYLWGRETVIEKPKRKPKSACKIKLPKEKKC